MPSPRSASSQTETRGCWSVGTKTKEECIMTNHVHLIIGSVDKKMEDFIRDIKRHTSKTLLKAVADNPQESRKEWMLWMFKRAGQQNPNNETYQFWQQNNHPIELWSNEVPGGKG